MLYEIHDLNFSYPGGPPVLEQVCLTLKEGEILTVLGPNGAGKSTLLNCMMGLLPTQAGAVRLCGRDITAMSEREIARLAGYVPQNHTPVFDYSVLEFVLMGRAALLSPLARPGPEDWREAEQALEAMGLSHLAHRPYTDISGGERQQATVARAIVRHPKVVLFDEPTAHLDFGNQLRVLRMVRRLSEEGYATVVTTHNPDHAILLGGTAAVLDRQGCLRSGPAEELLTEELLRQIYDTQLLVRYNQELGRRVCLYPPL
ncbi:iron ABC transporter ATP-binding protein [Flavonifractor sp. An52]|uniref:ABC transporter ATP-binding protein n=1 Tax=Flavonifractor sp. An52 TaxID=1965642 RepID=UPI000B39BE02|nr:ABC transporter ATP-binding protein [Flavonifractor sp. An52]OUN85557.1 iron ABC transporter ATP-binding protein [Flavonifractor sp. An52]